eukprot:Clim_evm21s167 gene=Clim_evmTU21s167
MADTGDQIPQQAEVVWPNAHTEGQTADSEIVLSVVDSQGHNLPCNLIVLNEDDPYPAEERLEGSEVIVQLTVDAKIRGIERVKIEQGADLIHLTGANIYNTASARDRRRSLELATEDLTVSGVTTNSSSTLATSPFKGTGDSQIIRRKRTIQVSLLSLASACEKYENDMPSTLLSKFQQNNEAMRSVLVSPALLELDELLPNLELDAISSAMHGGNNNNSNNGPGGTGVGNTATNTDTSATDETQNRSDSSTSRPAGRKDYTAVDPHAASITPASTPMAAGFGDDEFSPPPLRPMYRGGIIPDSEPLGRDGGLRSGSDIRGRSVDTHLRSHFRSGKRAGVGTATAQSGVSPASGTSGAAGGSDTTSSRPTHAPMRPAAGAYQKLAQHTVSAQQRAAARQQQQQAQIAAAKGKLTGSGRESPSNSSAWKNRSGTDKE